MQVFLSSDGTQLFYFIRTKFLFIKKLKRRVEGKNWKVVMLPLHSYNTLSMYRAKDRARLESENFAHENKLQATLDDWMTEAMYEIKDFEELVKAFKARSDEREAEVKKLNAILKGN